MAGEDDKLKDLKSRLGLVSQGGKPGVGKPRAPEPEPAVAEKAEVAVEADAPPVGSMAQPTREMEASQLEEYERSLDVNTDVLSSGKRGPLIILAVAIGLVAFGIGYFLGGNAKDRAMHDRVASDVKSLKGSLERKSSETNDTAIERIEAHIAATKAVTEKLAAIPEGNPEAVEKAVTDYLELSESFEEVVNFSAILGNGFLASKALPGMMGLALMTQEYATRVEALKGRNALLEQMKGKRDERYGDPSFGRKKLFVQVGSARIAQGEGQEVDVPMAWGEWVKGEITAFQQVPRENRQRWETPTEWRVSGVLLGKTESQLLPSAQVADVDMRPFLEPLDRGAHREVLVNTIVEIQALAEFGKTLNLRALSEGLN